jgi:hypothetical protein
MLGAEVILHLITHTHTHTYIHIQTLCRTPLAKAQSVFRSSPDNTQQSH